MLDHGERNITIPSAKPAIEKPGKAENGCGELDEAEATGQLGSLL